MISRLSKHLQHTVAFAFVPAVILTLLSLAVSCSQSAKPELVQPEKLAAYYVKLLDCAMDSANSHAAPAAPDSIECTDLDSTTLQQTFAYYQDHPTLWLQFISEVTGELERRKDQTNEAKAASKK